MAVPNSRPRNSGGLPLILISIVLALATAILVLFLVNGGANTNMSGVTVVVASRTVTTGAVLSIASDGSPNVRISTAFHTLRMPANVIPSDAFIFTSQDDLEKSLANHIVVTTILTDDVLRKNDARIAAIGNGPLTSITYHNPQALPPGNVIFTLHISESIGMQVNAQEGDHIDVLATACGTVSVKGASCQVAQTTLQNIAIYAVPDSKTLLIVLSHQDALVMKTLVETTHIDFVIRKPGDNTPAVTQGIDATWILNHFGFTAAG